MNDRGRAARAGSAGSSGDRDGPRSSVPDRRFRGYQWRGPLGLGFAVSAVLHLIALLLYSFSGSPEVSEMSVGLPDSPSSEAAGTQILNILAVAAEAVVPVEPEPEPEPEEAPAEAEPAEVDPGPTEGLAEELVELIRTAGEVLRPHVEDSIILREVNTALARLTDAEQAQLRMNWMVNEWNDLEDAERRRLEEALDWTYTDEEGKRWGVSPGKLHLGALTLPLPALGRAEGVDPAADRLSRDLAEIDDQAARGLVWQNWQRRAAEIRKRKDRERAARLGGQRVDTTGVRR
jgi:hypothetical protein